MKKQYEVILMACFIRKYIFQRLEEGYSLLRFRSRSSSKMCTYSFRSCFFMYEAMGLCPLTKHLKKCVSDIIAY